MQRAPVFVLALFLLGCVGTKEVRHTTGARPVHFCDLPTVPEEQPVSLIAAYHHGFETSELVDQTKCLVGMNFWVEFAKGYKRNSNRRAFRRLHGVPWGQTALVQFRGSYKCAHRGARGYGSLDFYACQFTVTAVEQFFGRVEVPQRQSGE